MLPGSPCQKTSHSTNTTISQPISGNMGGPDSVVHPPICAVMGGQKVTSGTGSVLNGGIKSLLGDAPWGRNPRARRKGGRECVDYSLLR
jgi:hypothetical protein